LARIPFPYRIEANHAVLGEEPLAVGPDFFKEEIAKDDRGNAKVTIGDKSLTPSSPRTLHSSPLRDEDLVKGDPQAGRLLLEQDASDPVHADPVEIARHSSQKGLNAKARRPLNLAERHAAVLAATPRHHYSLRVRLMFRQGFKRHSPDSHVPILARLP
jgi:hypothetical protein